jgi:hypothetical protein
MGENDLNAAAKEMRQIGDFNSHSNNRLRSLNSDSTARKSTEHISMIGPASTSER